MTQGFLLAALSQMRGFSMTAIAATTIGRSGGMAFLSQCVVPFLQVLVLPFPSLPSQMFIPFFFLLLLSPSLPLSFISFYSSSAIPLQNKEKSTGLGSTSHRSHFLVGFPTLSKCQGAPRLEAPILVQSFFKAMC